MKKKQVKEIKHKIQKSIRMLVNFRGVNLGNKLLYYLKNLSGSSGSIDVKSMLSMVYAQKRKKTQL